MANSGPSVAINIDQLFFQAPGGIGTYVREVVPRLADAGASVTLWHARFLGGVEEPWTAGYRRITLPQEIRLLYPAWNLTGHPRLPASLESADIVHLPSPVAIPTVGRDQRLVVTVHDLAFRFHPKAFPKTWLWLFRLGTRRAARRADAVIVPSRNTAQDLIRHAGADPGRVHVVPLAASLPEGAMDPGPTLERLKIRPPYVLFVGTLEPRKNLVTLVRAYRRAVAAAALPHRLVLAGPLGWLPGPLLHEVQLPGPGEVVLAGKTPREDLDALYRAADLFVYPSLYEGFGLPVLEAMSRGVPTITSNASSLPEVAGEAALLVDPRSEGALASAIQRVLTEPEEASRLAKAAAARAAEFSWERTAEMTLQVYRSLG